MTNAIHSLVPRSLMPAQVPLGGAASKIQYTGIESAVSGKLSDSVARDNAGLAAAFKVSLRVPEENSALTSDSLSSYAAATNEQRVVAEKAAVDEVQARLPGEEKNSPEIGERIKSDPRFSMLVALMLLIQQMVKTSRDEGAAAVNRQLTATVRSGEKTVSGARDQLAGAISAAVVVAGMSAMAAKNTMAGNSKIRTGVNGNSVPGNKVQGAMAGKGRAQVEATKNTPDLRGEKTYTDKIGAKLKVNGDKKNYESSGKVAVRSDDHEMLSPQAHTDQANAQSRAQDYFAKGQAIQATATTIGVISSSGAEISAASKRADAQLLENAARTNSSISGNEDGQVKAKQEAHDAALGLLQKIIGQENETAGHVIRNV